MRHSVLVSEIGNRILVPMWINSKELEKKDPFHQRKIRYKRKFAELLERNKLDETISTPSSLRSKTERPCGIIH